MTLTPKQKNILDFISHFTRIRGYAPSQKEIAENFGFKSLGTVQNYLIRLQKHGHLEKEWNAKRGMTILSPQPAFSDERAVPLPLSGQVAAGYPIEAVERNETIDVPASMLKKEGEHFVLRVTGESMIEDGILHGDFVVIRQQSFAKNGDTVVALVGNEATIKKFYKRKGVIELQPANAAYSPIIIEDEEDFRILGILVGVLRHFN